SKELRRLAKPFRILQLRDFLEVLIPRDLRVGDGQDRAARGNRTRHWIGMGTRRKQKRQREAGGMG
ncbi:MAG: hypothetical protein WA798_15970, partial [Candidatus Acidiferrum sp.]